jgi:hypothetical protein
MTDKPKKIRIVCRDCRSEDVVRDAWAEWDVEDQRWVLRDTYDHAYCNTCGDETKLEEVEIDETT